MLSNAQIQKGAGIARVAGVKGKDSDRFLETQSRRRFRAPLANASSGDATRFHVLHEIFEAQANARPNALAVAFGTEKATYLDLEQRANRIARHLRAQGVRPESRVALLLPRSTNIYAAILGILKAGAAYVPLDPEYPADRVAYILEDSGAESLLTTADLAERHAAYRGAIVRLDADLAEIDAHSPARLPHNGVGVGPRDLCYVIYTSGSTGRPKGVMIEHRSACHLVCAEGRIFAVRPEDRVYQGFSLAFDASIEEVWLAFHAGATLVAATPELAQAGPDLPRLLAESGVTVLSCVPTLLLMLTEDPVTIGRAVPGYRVHLLDDSLRPVPPGVVGEICIGGIGVARGYSGLEQLTCERFVSDPFMPGEPHARLYRTGDLGRLDGEGNIKFHGRSDSQVKLRGFRVELTEIESVLAQSDGVLAAACALREDVPGVQQLVGYVVPSNGQIDQERLRGHLRRNLPAYMVPALIETISDLPRLPSGKLDRANLPAPQGRTAAPHSAVKPPRTETERRIAEVWENLFRPQSVSIDADFFLDLGGHSLLAARMVSELRMDLRFASVSMADVYEHPTIALLASALDAALLDSQSPRSAEAPAVMPEQNRAGEWGRHFIAGLLQTSGLYFVFGFRAFQWVTPYLIYFMLLATNHSVAASAAWAAASAVAVLPALILSAVAAKWVLLGRIKTGRHRLWGGYYVRWWFVQNLVAALHLDDLCGTPLLPFVYRLFGARIGRNVHLETDDFAAFDLISIGNGTSVDDTASLLGFAVENGELVIGAVQVGRDCFVGSRSVVREHTVMEDGARLEDLSLLPSGARIPQGETWAGSPARRATRSNAATPPRPAHGPLRRAATVALYALLVPVIQVLPLAAFVPGVAILTQIEPLKEPLKYLAAAPLVGASFIILLTSGVVLFKWLLVGRVRAGTYPVHGGFYVRKWIIDQLLALCLDVAGSIHATLYLAPWYRALGAKLGRSVELSTATSMTPDLLEIGDGGTVADEVSLCAARVENGWMTLAPTRLGRRAFVGNGAVVPSGTVLGDGSLVGVLSVPPSDPGDAERPGASWMGSPPIFLPRRQPSAAMPDARTYEPPLKLRLVRGAVEILRVTLPPAGFILVTTTVITAALALWHSIGLGATLLLLPLVYAACGVAVSLAVVALKWIVMGRYQPFEHPLWSVFVWRLEFVNALYEFLVTPLLLEALQGTPLLPWYLRLLGARIGRRTYIHTTGFLEWDLVEVGDKAVISEDCVLQTHLFEDRVLKASRLRVGRRCEIGAASVVLYDSEMEDGARLDALSLLMKGEVLPADTAWAGSPAARRGTRAATPPAHAFSSNGESVG